MFKLLAVYACLSCVQSRTKTTHRAHTSKISNIFIGQMARRFNTLIGKRSGRSGRSY